MSNAKKTRGGESLHNALTPEQRVQLASWLTIENLSYEDTRELVESQFGVKTSRDALGRFYSSFAVPWQYAQAKGDADAFGALMEGSFDEANIKRARQLAFVALTDKTPNIKAAKELLKIVGDSAKHKLAEKRLGLDERKVTLLEAKAALADKATGIAGDENLSEEEKSKRIRALFGMG